MPWWAGKEEIREHLKKVNENGKVRISFTLLQLVLILTPLPGSRVYSVPARPFLRLPGISVQDGETRCSAEHHV